MGMTAEEIRAVYAKRRVKGLYEELLAKLLNESDEAGVDVTDAWPILKGKNATTLYQGFSNAAKKLDDPTVVDVINMEGNVFIMVTTRVDLEGEDETDEVEPVVEELDLPAERELATA